MNRLTTMFSSHFLRRLESLCVQSRQEFRTRRKGDRLANISGSSIEFADYRKYLPGDDVRHIDWNIYARSERLYRKTFKEDIDISTHILIDASRSMLYPRGEGKFEFARKLALALSYVCLTAHSDVKVAAFSDRENSRVPDARTLSRSTPFLSRRSAIFAVSDYLLGIEPGGGTDFTASLRRYLRMAGGRRGVIIIISDFLFEPAAAQRGLNLLRYRNYDVKAVQILGPGEFDPFRRLTSAELIDVETGKKKPISVTPGVRKEYARGLKEHLEGLRDFCRANRIIYSLARTDTDFESFVLRRLTRIGIIK